MGSSRRRRWLDKCGAAHGASCGPDPTATVSSGDWGFSGDPSLHAQAAQRHARQKATSAIGQVRGGRKPRRAEAEPPSRPKPVPVRRDAVPKRLRTPAAQQPLLSKAGVHAGCNRVPARPPTLACVACSWMPAELAGLAITSEFDSVSRHFLIHFCQDKFGSTSRTYRIHSIHGIRGTDRMDGIRSCSGLGSIARSELKRARLLPGLPWSQGQMLRH